MNAREVIARVGMHAVLVAGMCITWLMGYQAARDDMKERSN